MFAPKYFCTIVDETGVIRTSYGYTFYKEEIFAKIKSDIESSLSDFNRSGFRIVGQSGQKLIIAYIAYIDKTYDRKPDSFIDPEYALYCAIVCALDSSYHYDSFYAGGMKAGSKWDIKRLFDV